MPFLQALGRRIPFAFLDDIRDKFLSAYGPEAPQYAVAYEYNTEFSGVLQQRMRYFANDPNADAINRVRGGVAEVKNIMVENIEKVCADAPAHPYSFCCSWTLSFPVCMQISYACLACGTLMSSYSRHKQRQLIAMRLMLFTIQVLERGERIELLVDKTDHLQSESFAFKRDASRMKRKMWWTNVRWMAAVAAVILVIIYVVIAIVCSPTFHC